MERGWRKERKDVEYRRGGGVALHWGGGVIGSEVEAITESGSRRRPSANRYPPRAPCPTRALSPSSRRGQGVGRCGHEGRDIL